VPYYWRPGWTGSDVHWSRVSACGVVANLLPKLFQYAWASVSALVVSVEGRRRQCWTTRELVRSHALTPGGWQFATRYSLKTPLPTTKVGLRSLARHTRKAIQEGNGDKSVCGGRWRLYLPHRLIVVGVVIASKLEGAALLPLITSKE
jgi:hypothetical protein